MALRRDRRRITAVSVTLSAGALVFFAAGTGPASAQTETSATGLESCKLGKLLCGLLGAGKGTPASPPATSGGASTKPATRPAEKPKPKPKPRPKPAARPAPPGADGAVGGPVDVPGAPPAGADADVPVPDSLQAPALPDVADQDPVVVPGSGEGTAPAARLVAESAPDDGTAPPLLVATASGLIGAVSALNLSLVRRRSKD